MVESKALQRHRKQWEGKTISCAGRTGIVIGVGDDGAQCDYDDRRKANPTGWLLCIDADGVEFPALDSLSRVLPNKEG